MKPTTKNLAGLATIALALFSAAQSGAVPGGEIGTLPTGRYQCDQPGDETGLSRYRVPDEDFRVISASNYVTEEGRGSYLMTGRSVVMTGGPFKGRKYYRISYGVLRRLAPDGSDSDLRCVLVSER